MSENRLSHSLAVARKMTEIGKALKLDEYKLKELFVLGFNHDIGYEFCEDKTKHNIIGGKMLKDNGYKYWREVYHHGNPTSKYNSLYLNILNMADMQIDSYGNDIGYEKRLDDICKRYGEESVQYVNSKKIIEKLKEDQQ